MTSKEFIELGIEGTNGFLAVGLTVLIDKQETCSPERSRCVGAFNSCPACSGTASIANSTVDAIASRAACISICSSRRDIGHLTKATAIRIMYPWPFLPGGKLEERT